MASAMRCPVCLTSWPPELEGEEVTECFECGEQTNPMYKAVPIDEREALSRKRHAQFERYLDEHGRR